MPVFSITRWFGWLASRSFLRMALLVIAGIIVLAELLYPVAIRPSTFPLAEGEVAAQDILAPRSYSFTSQVLTDVARQDAENGVRRIYLPADPGVARHQIEELRASLDFISMVRSDVYSTTDQKIVDLSHLASLNLNEDTKKQILLLNNTRWQEIQQESLRVLEQVMRNTIRDDQLNEFKGNVPTLISLSFSQDQAGEIASLITPFIIPNSLFSDELTQTARLDARNAVVPITRSYISGETIVRRGQVITPVMIEALEVFGLVEPADSTHKTLAAVSLIFLVGFFAALFVTQRSLPPLEDFRNLLLIAVTFLLFLYGARLVIPNRVIIPYLFPLPAFGLVVASLFSVEIGLVFSLLLSILAAYGLPNSLDLTLFYVLTSFCGILVLGKGRRIASFFWAGIAIGASGSAVLLSYRLLDSYTDWLGITTLVGTAFLNGIASASLTLLLQFLFSQLLGLPTVLQLMEISRPDYPLLQFLLRNAPGTYQHSLQVANLAEQAAETIGADALLSRVGALYHDVGKSINASFFIENQVPGNIDSHDDLDPTKSAATIIQHVSDGLQLTRKYRMPPRIRDFISEHHGTLITRYQYTRAVEAAGDTPELLNVELFRYPGPAPRSRETALLMLADGCEARARAELPKDEIALRQLIKQVIDYCQKEGQLDNTSITLRDLNQIAASFFTTLKNIYHPRLRYPDLIEEPEKEK
jgi:cyclic-di-AMP phosphodiesterase PgpH